MTLKIVSWNYESVHVRILQTQNSTFWIGTVGVTVRCNCLALTSSTHRGIGKQCEMFYARQPIPGKIYERVAKTLNVNAEMLLCRPPSIHEAEPVDVLITMLENERSVALRRVRSEETNVAMYFPLKLN